MLYCIIPSLGVPQRTCDPRYQANFSGAVAGDLKKTSRTTKFPVNTPSSLFSGAVAGDLEASDRGVSHILSLYFVIVLLSILFVSLVLPFICSKTEKHKNFKNSGT